MSTFFIHYRFARDSGVLPEFTLEIDADTLEVVADPPSDPPEWTALGFHQCPNCPLREESHPHCPVALRFVDIAHGFEQVVSYDTVDVEVETAERTISVTTRAEQALASLMGVLMATSGCPRTAFFKPMARFHLPFASEVETTFRAIATYLLMQYLGGTPQPGLEGLREVYAEMRVVNAAMTRRLRAAVSTDSTLNAVVLLDIYAMAVPTALDDALEEIRQALGAPPVAGA